MQREMRLRIEVDQQRAAAERCDRCADVDGGGRFPNSALLVEEGGDARWNDARNDRHGGEYRKNALRKPSVKRTTNPKARALLSRCQIDRDGSRTSAPRHGRKRRVGETPGE